MSPASRGAWLIVVGARPNYVKAMPLLLAARAAGLSMSWLHTGQQIDPRLTRRMAADLDLPPPCLRMRSSPPGPERLAAMSRRLRGHFERLRPAGVVLLGDVDSTAAGALAAASLGIPLVHVEGGLRSGDRSMPEERNRVLADALADRIYLTEAAARENLLSEGVSSARLRTPGNVMADALHLMRERIEATAWPRGVPRPASFLLATLHRQANVDRPRRLGAWLRALAREARSTPVLMPVHPRTADRIEHAGLASAAADITWLPPLGYLAFLCLLRSAEAVLTDSGGIPVEAALLGVPCLTLRPVCEHQVTLAAGTNRLVPNPGALPAALKQARAGRAGVRRRRVWDGRAAERIVADLGRGVGSRAKDLAAVATWPAAERAVRALAP